MTREEAIEHLTEIKLFDIEFPNDLQMKALDIAIEALKQEPCEDTISREETLDAFADYVGSGMSMDDFDALWNIVAKMPSVKQESCDDCLFKKEWEKIGKLLSVVLEKQTEQEPKTGHWIDGKCDKCGNHAPYLAIAASTYFINYTDFCPNCGARMESEPDCHECKTEHDCYECGKYKENEE